MIKKIVALMMGAVLLAFVFTGCGKESATETINKAITKNGETKTVHTDYDVSFEIKGDASSMGPQYAGLLPITLAVKGGLDTDSNTEPAKMKGNVQISGLDQILQSLAKAGGDSLDTNTKNLLNQFGGIFSDVEFVSVDKNGYVKIAGTWYETGDLSNSMDSLGSLGSLGGMGSAGVGSLGASAGNVDSKCYQDAMNDPNKMGADNLFKDTQEMSEESIDGVQTRHFKSNIDFNKALTQMGTISKDCGNADASTGLETAKADIGSLFSKAEVEMWIDSDSNLRQMKVVIEIDPSALTNLAGDAGASGAGADVAAQALQSISLNMTFKFSKFNEEMNITKPAGDVKKIEDLMANPMIAGLISGLGGSSATSGLGSSILGGGSTSGLGTTGTTTITTPSYSR
ncbi:MAG: hypothetical protein WC828_02600 [Thermoleophilia bacterium]|jgi:hypothetical protein